MVGSWVSGVVLGCLQIPLMSVAMLPIGEEFQILKAIVRFYPVVVMDYLVWRKGSFQMFFHNVRMFEDVPSVGVTKSNTNEPIPASIDNSPFPIWSVCTNLSLPRRPKALKDCLLYRSWTFPPLSSHQGACSLTMPKPFFLPHHSPAIQVVA